METLQPPFDLAGRSLSITPSAGIAISRPDDVPEVLLRLADEAMYAAKNGGRNRFKTLARA
jgi:PleD family two-component response regulator